MGRPVATKRCLSTGRLVLASDIQVVGVVQMVSVQQQIALLAPLDAVFDDDIHRAAAASGTPSKPSLAGSIGSGSHELDWPHDLTHLSPFLVAPDQRTSGDEATVQAAAGGRALGGATAGRRVVASEFVAKDERDA